MGKKLKLEDLKIQSFVTNLEDNVEVNVKGGGNASQELSACTCRITVCSCETNCTCVTICTCVSICTFCTCEVTPGIDCECGYYEETQ